jgi:glycosyltransferase involved in cell wall biosynthesis
MLIVSVMTGIAAGGAEFAAVELLDALISRGHEVLMLSDFTQVGRDTKVSIGQLDLGPKLSASSLLLFLCAWPLWLLRLRRALAAQQPYDVLLLHFKKEQLLASLLPGKLRARLVWAEWGPVPTQMQRGPGRWLYAAAARRVQTVLAISDNTRATVIAAGVDPAKVAVLPNAIPIDRFAFSETGRARMRETLGIPADDFVVGCTSRFHPKKRNDVAVDAVARLGDRVHLVLAGAGEAEGDLRARAAVLGERAHFLPTPGADGGALFSAFDVCVFCPSPAEGSPTAVILGMLAERPCVATAKEGVDGLIEDGCGAVAAPENDPDALAAVLRDYAGDPERSQREGTLAGARARERFDANAVAAEAEWLLGLPMAKGGR